MSDNHNTTSKVSTETPPPFSGRSSPPPLTFELEIPHAHALRLSHILENAPHDLVSTDGALSPFDFDLCLVWSQLLRMYVLHHRALRYVSQQHVQDYRLDLSALESMEAR